MIRTCLFLLFIASFVELSAQISPVPGGFVCEQEVYSESFENGVPAGWSNVGVDQYKSGVSFNEGWVVDRDTTFTPGTGPNGAQDGDFYVYCDGSGPIGRGATASMTSPVIILPDLYGPALTFYINMHGRSGSFQLNVLANGNSTTMIPPVNGDVPGGIHASDEWEQVYVDLSQFRNQSIQLEFVTIKPSAINEGDIAIDNIVVCNQPNPIPTIGQWFGIILCLILLILGAFLVRTRTSTLAIS